MPSEDGTRFMAQRFFVSNVSVACAVPGVGFLLQARP